MTFPSLDLFLARNTLIRINFLNRRLTSIVYLTRFSYHVINDVVPGGGGSLRVDVDPLSRAVVRLKPFHVASVLVALRQAKPLSRCVSDVRRSSANNSNDAAAAETLACAHAVELRDPMFALHVGCTAPQRSSVGALSGSSLVSDAAGVYFSGTVWKDGFVDKDEWRGESELRIDDPEHVIALRDFFEEALVASFGF